MIKYSLRCDKEHVFEGWFSTGQDFDKQRNGVWCLARFAIPSISIKR